MHRVLRDRANRFQHFHFFVAQVFCRQGYRRLHRHQRQQLQQMALDHVAQRAGAFIVIGAPFDTQCFGMRDLHMIDVMVIPQRFQQQVGETEHHHVLHRALAEVVVDAVNLRFVEVPVQARLQRLCAQ